MRQLRLPTVAAVAAAGLFAAVPAQAAATWSSVSVAAVGRQSGLGGVDLVGGSDGWAVGSGNAGGLVEHWNGTAWTVTASPDVLDHGHPSNSAGLAAVDAVSSTVAFAVGTSSSYTAGDGLQHQFPVAERWNGSTWTRLAVPQPNYQTGLSAVKAFSATDVWALGRTGGLTSGQTFAVHWDGAAWTRVGTPSPGTKENTVTAVTGAAANDVWAFGWTKELPYGNRARNAFALHWNGSTWSSVALPSTGAVQTYLYGAVALSASDVWAVGISNGAALAYHWNGSAWSIHATPALQSLRGITALSATDVWASGADADGAPVLANWNGSTWSVTAVPTSGNFPYTSISGLAAAAPGNVSAVGITADTVTTGDSRPVALRTSNG